MNDRQKLQHLFGFDLWSTLLLTDFMLKQSSFDDLQVCIKYLSHIINSQKIWYGRVVEINRAEIDIWEDRPLDQIKSYAQNANREWVDLVADHEMDLDSVIHYQNSKGKEFQTPLWQICHHLVIHGQHHRAQISLLLRRSGITPPPTDYIKYVRDVQQ